MAEEDVNVRVSHGALRGRKVTAKAGNSYFSFQGIPYAKPPVGPLRFQVAQPVEPWDGVRDALKEGPSCPQIEWIKKLPYFGDEDCLYVNVYSPQLPSSQTLDYPVMVWIHGGGFEVGNGDEDIYGPEYLVGGNVVLVTFNYRLGIFGFLRVDDASVPGNVGLKDQVVALRWVKENIAVFGGDPNNVTIFGESAGGASVHYHLLSPMSQGLFHKAILQSGCALNPWASSVGSQELTFKLAKELGSDTSNVQELLSFLKTVPARDLVEKEDELKKMAGEIFPRFRPTPEEYSPGPGDEIFLPAHPKEMMEKRQFNSVPVMMGATSNEGIIVLDMMGILETPVNLDKIMELARKLLPKDLKSSSTEVERAVKEYIVGYKNVNQSQFTSKQQRGEEKNTAILPEFGSQPSLVLNRNHYQSLANLASDVAVHIGEDKTINILSEGPSPVFFYVFGFDGKLNFYKHFVKASEFTGASHLDDVGYLFATPFFKVPQVAPDSPEAITRKRMVKLWTDFAKTGQLRRPSGRGRGGVRDGAGGSGLPPRAARCCQGRRLFLQLPGRALRPAPRRPAALPDSTTSRDLGGSKGST